MKTKQQVVSEFRRTEILNAARSVFARKGFVRGIMDAIAKEAGLAKGTVYLYFRSKEEIYRAVLDHDMEFLKKNTLERIDAAKNLKDKIRAFTLARLENAEDKKRILSDHGHRIWKFVSHAKPIPPLASRTGTPSGLGDRGCVSTRRDTSRTRRKSGVDHRRYDERNDSTKATWTNRYPAQ